MPEAHLGSASSTSGSWIQEKLNRLIANPTTITDEFNADIGIMRVLPEIDWEVCENFCHIHFIVEYPDSKFQIPVALGLVPNNKFQIVLGDRPFREKFHQLETDLFGLNQLSAKLRILNQLKVTVKGLILAQTNHIVNHWVPNLFEHYRAVPQALHRSYSVNGEAD